MSSPVLYILTALPPLPLQTTAINVLTGFLEPSSGSAVVEGLDISVDMQRIYKCVPAA